MGEKMERPMYCNAHGQCIDILDIDPRTIHIHDIALGLAKEARFVGQNEGVYSVAQHCVIVSELVPFKYADAALLHDCAEWITGDIPSPVKKLLKPQLTEIEHSITRAVFHKFGVCIHSDEDPIPPAVHSADADIYIAEMYDLMPIAEILKWFPLGQRPKHIQKIRPLSWKEAYKLFMARYEELWHLSHRRKYNGERIEFDPKDLRNFV